MPPSADQIREVMRAYVKAMCDDDVDTIMSLYAEDASVEDPVGTPPRVGRAVLRDFYAMAVPSLQVEITGPIRVAGHECAVPIVAAITTADSTRYIDVVDVMKFDDDGRIVSMRAFWNPAEMRDTR
jgi:steroid delta-isomerase